MITKVVSGGQTGVDLEGPLGLVIFKEIDRLPGYRFGDDGSVWSRWAPRHKGMVSEWRQIFGWKRSDGYWDVSIKIGDKSSSMRIHRLILEAFIGPCPDGMEGRHVDDNDRSNNRLSNLCWGTPKQNTEDRRRHGTLAIGERIGNARLKKEDIALIYDLFERGELIKDIADRFSLDHSYVSKVLRGKYWAHAVPGREPPLKLDARQRGAIERERRKEAVA